MLSSLLQENTKIAQRNFNVVYAHVLRQHKASSEKLTGQINRHFFVCLCTVSGNTIQAGKNRLTRYIREAIGVKI